MTKEQRYAITREKIKGYMEKAKTAPLNLSHNFAWQCVIAIRAPQFYSEEELTQIKKHSQLVLQETRKIPQNTVEGEVANTKKRCRPCDEVSMSYAERRTKPKTTKKVEPKKRTKPKTTRKVPKKQDKKNLALPPPILPINVKNKIKELNGTDIRYIMSKKLFASDIDEGQSRLLMPLKEDELGFLTKTEKETLDEKDENDKPVGLEVIVLDPYFRSFTMCFKKWKMTNKWVYSLIQNWKHAVRGNGFEIGQILNVWSFRVKDKLQFVLNIN
ncbi:DUF313 domain protein [Medicago truncatula]|uniref:DUF313 domain protein n=2 Tax=Medicago truncatula TaxID=3880 RepID=G7KYG9_MEDTR|nr:DUF313 domain protein [Medicago truncatula]